MAVRHGLCYATAMMRYVLALALAALVALPACHHEPAPVIAGESALPPLPPSSGTPIGYLLDARDQLALRADQVAKLKQIDSSLATRNAEIDTQLRELQPKEAPEDDKSHHGEDHEHHNNAPGAAPMTSNQAHLHEVRNRNDREALRQAWALLDPTQQTKAAAILQDRGVPVPGQKAQQAQTSDDGTPVPGLGEQ